MLATISIVVYDRFIDDPYQNYISEWHNRIIHHTAPAPTQYRILIPYLAEYLRNLTGGDLRYSYLFLKIFTTGLVAILLFYFASFWLNPIGCLFSVLIFFATLPLTFVWHFYQPMDLPNLLFFLLGYIFIVRNKDYLLYLLLPLAMLNRETAILLVLVYFFVRLEEKPLPVILGNSLLLGIIGLGVYFALRHLIGIKEYYSDAFYLKYNLSDPKAYLYSLLFLNLGLFISWVNWREKPKFFRRAMLFVPFFLAIHWSMTLMKEPRLLLPLGPLFWVLGIWENFPSLRIKTITETKTNYQFPMIFKITGYLILTGIFLIFLAWFYHFYSQLHLRNRWRQQKVENLLNEASIYLSMNNKPAAKSDLLIAEQLQPDSDEVNYQLGRFYYYYEYNLTRAKYYWEKCLQLNPDHHARPEILFYLSQIRPGQ